MLDPQSLIQNGPTHAGKFEVILGRVPDLQGAPESSQAAAKRADCEDETNHRVSRD